MSTVGEHPQIAAAQARLRAPSPEPPTDRQAMLDSNDPGGARCQTQQ